MSAQSLREDEPQSLESVESLGKRLRIARQARGMSQNDVALRLHLSRSMIQALESDDYGGLPGPVFVRGYIRNYARLLGLDDSAVLSSFNQGQSEQPQRPAPIRGGIQPEIRSSHFAVRLVSWFIVIGLIGLLGAWWQGHLKWDGNETAVTAGTPEPAAPEPLSEDGTLRLPRPYPGQAPEQLPQIGDTVVESEPTAATEKTSPPEASRRPPEPAPTRADGATATEPETASDTTPASTPAPEATTAPQTTSEASEPKPTGGGEAGENQIVFEFTGPCWVDIRDVSRTFKIFGEMKKGDRKILEGTPPYSVILGNSGNVQITMNGRPFDIQAHSRGSVARFTLDPKPVD